MHILHMLSYGCYRNHLTYGDTDWGKGERNWITGMFLYWMLPWYVIIILVGCAAAVLTLKAHRISADFER